MFYNGKTIEKVKGVKIDHWTRKSEYRSRIEDSGSQKK
jgi:hypothetical protein